MIKQALNAAAIADIMRTFAKDDAVKLLGKSTYNKWLKKLPADSIYRGSDNYSLLKRLEATARVRDADRLKRAQAIDEDLANRYGPGFVADLPRVDKRLNTRGRLKGTVLRYEPRVDYLREFADRNNLVSRDELLQWNRTYKAGLDPKTLTSEWYVRPGGAGYAGDVAGILRTPRFRSGEIYYNGKDIPEDTAYINGQIVRNIAAVPYTDPIRHTAEQLVANELHRATKGITRRRSIYNAVSDNTRKVLNYINGRNILEDPRAARLVEAANKHGRLNIDVDASYKDGTNAAFFPEYNILATHPRLTQDTKNHELAHGLLYNMDEQKHADVASRVFRGINAISRKNPEYSELARKLIDSPAEAHEAVTDYHRHKLFGTLGSHAADHKAMGSLNTELHYTKPVINHIVSETQNLTSNPSVQQALQQLSINYRVPLSNTINNIPYSVLELARRDMRRAERWEQIKQRLLNLLKPAWS